MSKQLIKELGKRWLLLCLFLPLICALIIIGANAFLDFQFLDWIFRKREGVEDRTMIVMIVVSAGLVFIGTILYLAELLYATYRTNAQKELGMFTGILFCAIINVITVFASLGLIFASVSVVIMNEGFDFLYKFNGWVNGGIFLLFLTADYKYFQLLKSMILKDSKNTELVRAKKEIFNVLFLVDLPGLIGVLVIVILSTHYARTSSSSFVHGISVGALTIHLIMMQFNVAYLKIRSLWQRGVKCGLFRKKIFTAKRCQN